jgi:Ca2+-dependent lipid-binding protein
MGIVTVTLDKCMNLRDKDGVGRSDPYVVFELKKERIGLDKNYGKKESSRKANTTNPVFGERFDWHGVDDLNNVKLHIKIYDEDIGRDDSLGHAVVDLEHAVLSSSPKEIVAVVDKKRFKLINREEATIHMHVSYS